ERTRRTVIKLATERKHLTNVLPRERTGLGSQLARPKRRPCRWPAPRERTGLGSQLARPKRRPCRWPAPRERTGLGSQLARPKRRRCRWPAPRERTSLRSQATRAHAARPAAAATPAGAAARSRSHRPGERSPGWNDRLESRNELRPRPGYARRSRWKAEFPTQRDEPSVF